MKPFVPSLLAAFLLGSLDPAAAGERPVPVRPAQLRNSARLTLPQPKPLQIDSTLACFEGQLSVLLNPGCFQTEAPPQPGDCTSRAQHFMVQYLFPDLAVPHQVLGFGFLNNDGETVFPSGGVIPIPIVQGIPDFPTTEQLANLQVRNISFPGDTTVVFVDLEASGIILPAGADVALVVALQFPEGGELVDVGIGPGIATDADPPDQLCDLFTIDGGETWFEPAPCDPGDPLCEPLDWGFVVLLDPILSLEAVTWTTVKSLYRTP